MIHICWKVTFFCDEKRKRYILTYIFNSIYFHFIPEKKRKEKKIEIKKKPHSSLGVKQTVERDSRYKRIGVASERDVFGIQQQIRWK